MAEVPLTVPVASVASANTGTTEWSPTWVSYRASWM